MKTKLILLMVAQTILFSLGLYFVEKGYLFFGVFNVIINFVGFIVNLRTCSKLTKH